jgi:ABC-type lipoprotein release transport system permease subunit
VGIDPDAERAFSGLDSRLIRGRYLQANGRGVVLGEGYAAQLGLQVGDTLVLLGQGYQENIAAWKFPVFGIVNLGLPQLNDAVVYLPLHAAQDWLSATDRVTAVIIVPEAAASVQAVAERLRAQLGPRFETMSWQEMLPEIDKHMHGDAVNFYI